MDQFRQIRYLVAPFFFFASIIFGRYLENPYSRRNRRCSTYTRRPDWRSYVTHHSLKFGGNSPAALEQSSCLARIGD